MKLLPVALSVAFVFAGSTYAEEVDPAQQAADIAETASAPAKEAIPPTPMEPAPAEIPTAGEVQAAPAPKLDLTPALRDSTPTLRDSTPAAQDTTPAPQDLTPAPQDLTPAPQDLTPAVPEGATPLMEGEPTLTPDQIDAIKKPLSGGVAAPMPDEARKEKAKPSRTEEAENQLDLRIRYRQAYMKVLPNADIQEFWRAAQTSRTDYEKRAWLNQFYTALYGRMEKLEPLAKILIDENRTLSLRRLVQTRVQPTERPLWLASDVPSPAASKPGPPTSSGKKGKTKAKAEPKEKKP